MSIPDLFYEQIVLGEKSKEELLAQYPNLSLEELDAKLLEIQKSNQEILKTYPADRFDFAKDAKIAHLRDARSVRGKARAKLTAKSTAHSTRVFSLGVKIASFATAACLVIALSFISLNQLKKDSTFASNGILESATRLKGSGARLFVYKKESSGALLLKAGAKIKQNDVLQVSYTSGGKTFGAILSVDGNGTVTQHFPEYGKTAEQLNQKGETPLDYAYRLDNAPKFERFIFITASYAFPLGEIIQDISRAVHNGFSPSFDLSVFLPSKTESFDILFLK